MLLLKALVPAILFSSVNGYLFSVIKITKTGSLSSINCDFGENSLGISKYKSFMKGNKYSENTFTCFETVYGSECISKVENINCGEKTGHEGTFCKNYGGSDSLVYCSIF
jgi:hypothetical protein